MSAIAVEQGNVRCGICQEFIPGVIAKSSMVMTALNYPDKWDDDLECLVDEECQRNAMKVTAWLKHSGLKTCIKVGRNNQ